MNRRHAKPTASQPSALRSRKILSVARGPAHAILAMTEFRAAALAAAEAAAVPSVEQRH